MKRILRRTSLTLAVLAAGCFFPPGPARAAEKPTPEDKEVCRQNLNLIYEAIQSYRRDHLDWPKWLSDLVPRYLADANTLVCPAFRRSGESRASLRTDRADSKVFSTYTYEFTDLAMGAIWSGWGMSTRQWKQRQVGLVGSDLPLVRCHQHGPVQQVVLDGRILESAMVWEYQHTNVVSYGQFSPYVLLASPSEGPPLKSSIKPLAPIPMRSTDAAPHLLDLSSYYNGSLTAGWLPDSSSGITADKTLPLPPGVQKLGGVEFDVRGVIQLTSHDLESRNVRFPSQVNRILVGQRCRRLHFLHATHNHEQRNVPVGLYRVHYANGQDWDVLITYARDTVAWIGRDYGPDQNPVCLVWTGTNAATRTGELKLRLSKLSWENPFPGQIVESLDFMTRSQTAGPFLVAITVEP